MAINFSSHNEWGADHFGFIYHGDLCAFCDELRVKGVSFPVALRRFTSLCPHRFAHRP